MNFSPFEEYELRLLRKQVPTGAVADSARASGRRDSGANIFLDGCDPVSVRTHSGLRFAVDALSGESLYFALRDLFQ